MEDFLRILIPAALLFGLLRLFTAQIKWMWKLAVNSLGGFFCLWILNLVSPVTGVVFEINFVTCLIAGLLGIPGIILLVIGQLL